MNTYSKIGKFYTILALVLGGAIVYFGYTALGGANIATTINLLGPATTLDDGLVAHWTFDGDDALKADIIGVSDTTGDTDPTSGINRADLGITAWTDGGNIFSSNDVDATAAMGIFGNSQYLEASDFGFAIPTGSTITGIEVDVERAVSGTGVFDGHVRLVLADASLGTADKSIFGDWPTSDAYVTYGGSGDTWGETLSSADVNDPDFGFAIRVGNSAFAARTATVDHIRMNVYYTEADTPQIQVQSRVAGGSQLNAFNSEGTTAGAIGQAIAFDGVDDYATTTALGSGLRTISFWMKTDDNTTRKVINIDGTDQIELNGSGQIVATSFPGTTNIYIDGESGSQTTEGQWHHVVITDTTGVNGSTFELGRVSTSYFDGMLDDLRIFNRVISEDEIKQLYRLGATTKVATTPEPKGPTVSLDDGLVGHWTFDGDTMNIFASTDHVLDQSGEANHGDIVGMGAGTTTVRGVLGQALSFDGVDDAIGLTPPATLPGSSTFGVAFWARSPGYSTSSVAVSIRNGTSQITSFNISPYRDLTGDRHYVWFNNNTLMSIAAEVDPVDWNHFAYTSYSSTDHRFYVNGEQVGTAGANKSLPDPLSDVNIGTNHPGTEFHYDGDLDDVRIYDRTLLPDEIRQLYRQGATTKVATTPEPKGETVTLDTGLVGHWTFDGGTIDYFASSDQIIDSSGSGNHGDLIGMGAGTTTERGVLGQAMLFANGQFVNIGSIFPTSAYTKTAWIRMNGLGNGNNNILSGGDADEHAFWVPSCKSYFLASGHSGTTCAVGQWDDVIDSQALEVNQWYFVAVTYDSAVSSGTMRLYRDGVEVDSATGISAPASGTSYIATYGSGTALTFNGNLDDVRLYNRALSADEIRQLYRMGR